MQKLALVAAFVAVAFVATPAFAACDTVNSKNLKLSACIDESDWVLQAPQGDQEYFYLSDDQSVGFILISEKETFTPSDFRGAVLANAKAGNGDKDVQILKERVENVGDKPWNVLDYQFGEVGSEIEFQNFYYSQPGFGSVQLVFWSLPGDATVAAYRAGKLLSTLQYGN